MKNVILLTILLNVLITHAQQDLSYTKVGRGFILSNGRESLRITPYGNYIVRVQVVRTGEDFFADDRYEMVQTHEWPGSFSILDEKSHYKILSPAGDGISLILHKTSTGLAFFDNASKVNFLNNGRTQWANDSIAISFEYDSAEHFTGLGHGYYGREESLDLKGKIVSRNYGTEHGQQSPLIVPFYLSSKGYAIFLNSTFPNQFNFGKNESYNFSIAGGGQMDFFVILGPDFSQIIDRYTQLTGRPRLPPRAFFGLALSDKGNDHNSADPSNEIWWKKKIMEHRQAGFPLDHIVNDNRWRAKGGQRCVSCFEWDTVRYPDPHEYAQWIKSNGLITTLDFNRCIAVQSEGWKPSFNLPQNEGIDFNTSAPDFTKQEVREWFWSIMWKKSLNPTLGYPGDALWIDEFDEMGKAPLSMKFENGSTWLEMRNYWFFLIAKSLVKDGWDKSFQGTKRPFVWVRGMTAGAQRYATLWSGDINSTYSEMKTQVRSLQMAGLSGFPFWAHDAGGFHLGKSNATPTDAMYQQWSMAFGSFTPFWKPHGVGYSRWPLDRPRTVQNVAKLYSELRYKLIPYIYSFAHIAAETGLPMARAMVIEHQNDSIAWLSDLQYMWGNEFLVAPNCSDSSAVKVWLPKGIWFDFWNDQKLSGDQVISYQSPMGQLPLFVKAGSIIPMANYALSTSFIHPDSLILHVYPGQNGSFTLYEDDGNTEAYKIKNEIRTTLITFDQSTTELKIEAARGGYENAPSNRAYQINFHALNNPRKIIVNNRAVKKLPNIPKANENVEGAYWDDDKKILSVFIKKTDVNKSVVVKVKK